MRLWISKSSEVPIREQLTTQILLAIASGELQPSQKLPSTRELARRFKVHSNTVSAAYRELGLRGWVESRKGSGVYVRTVSTGVSLDTSLELDQLISTFLAIARSKGFSLCEIQSRVKTWLEFQPPDHFLVIEPDVELRNILIAEIKESTGFPVSGAGLEECSKPSVLSGAAPVTLYGQADTVRAKLPFDMNCIVLRSRSVQETVRSLGQLPKRTMILVISCWPEFLRWSRATLVAAGNDAANLSFRDAREQGWKADLRLKSWVITDLVVSRQLPKSCRASVFRIIAESSLSELKSFVEQFLSNPTASAQ